MPHLSPQTMTHAEQRAILRATRRNLRDHLIYSLALGTGLRLAEIVGLNVGDVYSPDGKPKNRHGKLGSPFSRLVSRDKMLLCTPFFVFSGCLLQLA